MELTTAMLADAAIVSNGKIYVHGGGWDTIQAPSVPTSHPTLALALVFRVEYSEALVTIPISIDLVDDDEQDVGVKAQGVLNVGHPAGMQVGSPLFLPQAITLNGLQFQKYSSYRFRITTEDREIGSVPFRVAPSPPVPQIPTPGR